MEAVAVGHMERVRQLTRKPKLLIVGSFPPDELKVFGGVATVCRALTGSSLRDRFDLVLVDSTQRSNPPPGLFVRIIFGLDRAFAYCRALIMERPDVVMLFCSVGGSAIEKGAMARLARVVGIPSLVFPRGGRLIEIAAASRFHRVVTRWSLKGANRFLCQGPAWQRFAVDVIGFPRTHAPIVPNWTATNELLAIGSARAGRPANAIIRFLFLGWLEKEKGIFELLRACADLADSYSFQLVIAGKGRAEPDAREFVKRSGMMARVRFAGWVEGTTLEQLLAESDVLVLPSWAEGLPNAMIEAMAAGLAVVVSAVGNVADVIKDGQEALLVPPKRVELLQSTIQRLLDDPVLLRAIAARGHAFARRNFAVEPAVATLSKAIYSVLNRQGTSLTGL